jgi:hypothetical protein
VIELNVVYLQASITHELMMKTTWLLIMMRSLMDVYLQVAIEPAQASDMSKLVEGLRLLNRADPFVEVQLIILGVEVSCSELWHIVKKMSLV